MAKVITEKGSSSDTSSSTSGDDEESDQIKDMKMSLKNLEKKLSSLKEDHEGTLFNIYRHVIGML